MGSLWRSALSVLILCGVMVSMPVRAGLNEGVAAYERGDFAAALKQFRPLAAKGNAGAQNNLGVMYENGQGVPQGYREGALQDRKPCRLLRGLPPPSGCALPGAPKKNHPEGWSQDLTLTQILSSE